MSQSEVPDDGRSDFTTVTIGKELHSRLDQMKVYPSMSFHDLIEEMADQYDPEVAE